MLFSHRSRRCDEGEKQGASLYQTVRLSTHLPSSAVNAPLIATTCSAFNVQFRPPPCASLRQASRPHKHGVLAPCNSSRSTPPTTIIVSNLYFPGLRSSSSQCTRSSPQSRTRASRTLRSTSCSFSFATSQCVQSHTFPESPSLSSMCLSCPPSRLS